MDFILRNSDIGYLKDVKDADKIHVFVPSRSKPVISWDTLETIIPYLSGKRTIVVHETASHDMELFTLGGLLIESDAEFTAVNLSLPKEITDKYKDRLKSVKWSSKETKTTKRTSRTKKTVKTVESPAEGTIIETSAESDAGNDEPDTDDADVP